MGAQNTLGDLVRNIASGIPVCGFTGVNGSGKTLLAVSCAIADMMTGREVYSTVPIEYVDPKTGAVYRSHPIVSLRQLLELRNCTVLLDEVAVIFSSRSSQSLPNEVVAFLQTLRHLGITVLWTAPGWMRCDNLLRQSTQGVVNVTPVIRKHGKSPWPTPILAMAGLLDTTEGATDEAPTKVLRRSFFVPSRSRAWGSYDTLADTPLLGRHLQGGTCADCGGSLERHKHSEARHQDLGIPFYPELRSVRVQAEGALPIAGGVAGENEVQGSEIGAADGVAALARSERSKRIPLPATRTEVTQ